MYINPSPSNAQDTNRRLSIKLLLNPMEDAASHPLHGASQVVLPPLGSLDLLTSPGPAPQPTTHYQDHYWFGQQRNYEYNSSLSSNSSPSISSSSRSNSRMSVRSRSTSQTPPPHSNVPYTLEQVHFILYHRDDKGMQWQSMVQPFKKQFPEVVSHMRNKGALECRYYRAQMYPQINDECNFVLDQNGEVEMVNVKVRDRSTHRHRAILKDYFKLVTRCPELVETYPWTDKEDKEKARSISKSSCVRSLCLFVY